jgi:hypothetical protein
MNEQPSSDSNANAVSPGASHEKATLECEKLQLEIAALRRPFLKNPSHWISSATAILAITALFFQYRLSKNEFILAETKSVQAKIETAKAEEATKRLTQENRTLEQDIAEKARQRDQLELLVRNADTLLNRAQATADPKLRSDIESLRETTKPSSPFWASLPGLLNKPELKDAAQVSAALREANNQLTSSLGQIQSKMLNGFQTSQTGYNPDWKNKRLENQLALVKPGYQQPVFYTKYVMQVVGEELQFVFLADGKETVFYRTPSSQPLYNQDFEEAVKRSLEPQLTAELKRSE